MNQPPTKTDPLACGERLVRCLAGQPVDRVPFGVGCAIGWGYWGETIARWRKESGNPNLSVAETVGYEPSFAIPALHPGIFPEFKRVVLEETAEWVVFRNERGITQRNLRTASMPDFLEYPVKTRSDWEKLKRERLAVDQPGRVAQNWDEFRTRLKEIGEGVQVGWYPFGVFGTARDLLGVESLLLGFYDQPDLIHDIMDHLTTLWISIWTKVAGEVQIDHLHIWEDMSGRQGALISPDMVREFMMPCYDRIVGFARSAGVRLVSVDTDGDGSQLVPLLMEHGVNVFLPFEVQAGNDIREYRQKYPTLGIMGGLDKRALAGTRADIDREVDKAAHMVSTGRYVPAFDHLIPPDVPWANFCYAAERIKAICRIV